MKIERYGPRAPSGHRIGAWHQNAKHSDETVARARRLRASGMTYIRIGILLDVPWRTVVDWCTCTTRYDGLIIESWRENDYEFKSSNSNS